jgi:hypothetical protein
MVFTVAGKVISDREVHRENVEEPIYVNPNGRDTLFRLVQPSNAE